MLSDESNSDSETGRFKDGSKPQEEQISNQKSDNYRETGRSRQSGHGRLQRNFYWRREDRDPFEKIRDKTRDRNRFSRYSPITRIRRSRDRSVNRKSPKRSRQYSDRSRYRDHRTNSIDTHRHAGSRFYISHDNRMNSKDEVRHHTIHDRSCERPTKKSREKSLSPVQRGKSSEVYRPPPMVEKRAVERKKRDSPIIIEENDHGDYEEVQFGSYYNMIPADVNYKSDKSSEFDSSDDERLRAKLLNSRKKLHRTKKPKKTKRKSFKSSKDRKLNDITASVEVTSTTVLVTFDDIKLKPQISNANREVMEEISSPQKSAQYESCEEGEVLSDDSHSQIRVDPTILKHKLSRTAHKAEDKSKLNECGAALPPHLEKRYTFSTSCNIEGPALAPHLQQSKNVGTIMLSDESSSDSETGRFKDRSKTQEEQTSNQKSDNSRETGRSRQSGHNRFQRNFERRRDDRDPFEKHSRDRDRDRHRFSRHSPVSRRRHSRDRSANRKSHERGRQSSDRSRYRDHRSNSKDTHRHTGSRSFISHDNRKNSQDEVRHHSTRDRSCERPSKKSREKSLSPVHRVKRSEVYRPPPMVEKRTVERKKSDSPIIIEENDHSDHEEVQLGSYYNMIPAVVKDKSDESSEIDSSDDERLRAKLLNLEKELHRTKKQKKHKKKHKRKSSKSSKDRELNDTSASVEVTSTTDIKVKPETSNAEPEVVEEVSSTQKSAQKESCEEGEISSDDSHSQIHIDPTDLRHKLRRTAYKSEDKSKSEVCGPALPPHLEKRHKLSTSCDIEGPALPPHFQRNKNVGPAIADDMRKVLAEKDREVIKYESSEEDDGIGPLPAGSEEKWSDAHRRLEERALDIKIKNLDGHSEPKIKTREKWMLELPEGKAKYIGLEARSFRAKEGPDMSDRSSWTDTPEEKARKEAGVVKEEDLEMQLKKEARLRLIANRDEEQELTAKKHKKKHKREESLLEMHQKKLKKKKKKEDKDEDKKERRPFSRDLDLQVNRFDEAQKKSIIKKAQDLNSRFGRGEAKYL